MLLRSTTPRLLVASLFAASAGCRSAPEAAPATALGQPRWSLAESYAPGGVIGGPGALPAEPAAAVAPGVSLACRLLYLERPLVGGLAPVELDGTFAVDLEGRSPVLDTPRLVAGGRIGSAEAAEAWLDAVESGDAGRAREVFAGRPWIPVGSTYRVEASAWETVNDPLDWLDEFADRGPIEREVGFSLTATEDGLRLAIAVGDLDPVEEARRREERLEAGTMEPGPPPPAYLEVVRRETLLLDSALAPGETFVATLPSPFREGEGRLFAFVVEPGPAAPDPDRVAAVEAALARVAEDHAARTDRRSVAEVLGLLQREALSAFEAGRSRSALLLLAAETGALLAEDLALTGPDELLVELSEQVFEEASAEQIEQDLGWILESAAWRLVCARALEDEADTELRAPLYRHAGALAGFPDVVLDAVAASADLEGFRARLAEEHLYFLDDPDPSARLRAHDWLDVLDLAVEGYDPFAPREERRAALEREREAREAPAEESAEEGDA